MKCEINVRPKCKKKAVWKITNPKNKECAYFCDEHKKCNDEWRKKYFPEAIMEKIK